MISQHMPDKVFVPDSKEGSCSLSSAPLLLVEFSLSLSHASNSKIVFSYRIEIVIVKY